MEREQLEVEHQQEQEQTNAVQAHKALLASRGIQETNRVQIGFSLGMSSELDTNGQPSAGFVYSHANKDYQNSVAYEQLPSIEEMLELYAAFLRDTRLFD